MAAIRVYCDFHDNDHQWTYGHFIQTEQGWIFRPASGKQDDLNPVNIWLLDDDPVPAETPGSRITYSFTHQSCRSNCRTNPEVLHPVLDQLEAVGARHIGISFMNKAVRIQTTGRR